MNDFSIGFLFGAVLLFFGYIVMTAVTIPMFSEPHYPEAISFTAIDHDENDNTIYTSDGEILSTNKYQWRRIELNKTYVCDEGYLNSFYNCHEAGAQ